MGKLNYSKWDQLEVRWFLSIVSIARLTSGLCYSCAATTAERRQRCGSASEVSMAYSAALL